MILPLLDVEDQFIMESELDRILYHQGRIEDVSLRIDQFIMESELDRILYHQGRIEDVSLRIAAKTVKTEDSLKADESPSEPAIAEE